MTAINAIVRDGRIELNAPSDWPDGTEVTIQPACAHEACGIPEEDWPESPEGMVEWLKWYDSLEPLIFTAQERDAWKEARQQQEEFEKADFNNRAEKLRRTWG